MISNLLTINRITHSARMAGTASQTTHLPINQRVARHDFPFDFQSENDSLTEQCAARASAALVIQIITNCNKLTN